MKRALLAMFTVLFCCACGNPAVIAYSRGLWFEREADRQTAQAGTVDNAARAKYFKAIEQYNAAIHFNPSHSESFYHRGLCRARVAQMEEAASDFSQTIKLDPENADAYRDRGLVYEDLCQFGNAVSDFDIARKAIRDDPRILHGSSYCKMYSGDLLGALADEQKAIELSPTPTNYCRLATIQRRLGDRKEMDKAFAKAVQLNAHRVPTYQTRGFAQFLCGRYAAAFSDFNTVLSASQWKGKETPYSVLFAMFSARAVGKTPESNRLLDQAMERLQLNGSVKPGSKDAKLSAEWPNPAIQYFHGDISQEALLRAAEGDKNKETEARCYLGMESYLAGDKRQAKKFFEWVALNGRLDYVEYEVAQEMLKKIAS